jgi:hypothetical protein
MDFVFVDSSLPNGRQDFVQNDSAFIICSDDISPYFKKSSIDLINISG